MDQSGQGPLTLAVAHSQAAAFDEAYIRLRGTYVEALSDATSEQERLSLQDQVIRIIRFRAMVDLEDRSEVLAALAAVRADQETAD